jgi:hypothetical protein
MIAAKILGYYWIDGKISPADIVSKHWAYTQIWHLLKPLLFYSGDPGDLIEPAEEKKENAKTDVWRSNPNNSSTADPFQSVVSELARSSSVHWIWVFYHWNPADIGEDTIILGIIIWTQFHHTKLFVVTNAIHWLPTVRFTPKFQRLKDLFL